MTNSIVEISNISFSFSNNPIFTDFSCSFRENEITTIIGNSGCGKSTLLNLISKLLVPNDGGVTVNGSFVFLTQHLTLLPYKNAYENALLACELRNKKTEQKRLEANRLFELFKLSGNSENKFPQELSGGMQQRIGLIQSLLVDAQIYLLDEPLKEIDRATGLTIQSYMWNRFKANNISALIVTHDIEQAVLISDKILFLSSNKPSEELIFDKNFVSTSPDKRIGTESYSEYMLLVIKKLSELQ